MLKSFKLFFFFFFLLLNSNAQSNEKKIVYLNLENIFQNSKPGKLILEDLSNKQKINIEKFKKKEIELRNAEQDIIKKKNILSKEEFDVKARALNEQMKEYNIIPFSPILTLWAIWIWLSKKVFFPIIVFDIDPLSMVDPEPISQLSSIFTKPMWGYLIFLLLFGKKPKPCLPIIQLSKIFTLLPTMVFLIIELEPIEQLLPIDTFFSIIVLCPIEQLDPNTTFFPTKTFFPNLILFL